MLSISLDAPQWHLGKATYVPLPLPLLACTRFPARALTPPVPWSDAQTALAFARTWHHVSAADRTLGTLASRIAWVLMGKHKPVYDPAGEWPSWGGARRGWLMQFALDWFGLDSAPVRMRIVASPLPRRPRPRPRRLRSSRSQSTQATTSSSPRRALCTSRAAKRAIKCTARTRGSWAASRRCRSGRCARGGPIRCVLGDGEGRH